MIKLKEKIKAFRFTRKKALILCAVALLAALGTAVALKTRVGAAPPAGTPQKNTARTTVLSKTTLAESVTVTGTVKSTSVNNVTSSLSYPVSEISVKEGDSVTEGQVLAQLSTEELDKQIARQKEAINDAVSKAQAAYDEAVAQRDTAYNNAVAQESALASAQATRQSAENAYNAAKAAVTTFQTACDNTSAFEKAAIETLNNAAAAALAAPDDVELKAALDTAQAEFDTAVINAKAAQEAFNSAKSACGYDSARQGSEAAEQEADNARKSLNSLEGLYESTIKNVTAAKLVLDNAADSDALTELLEKRSDCTVTAPASGTITNVNAALGSSPQIGTALFIIQDTNKLKASISIDEYDIKKITEGMRARIKSDATGDKQIEGIVSQISLTAQSAAGTGGSSSTSFGAEVTVEGEDSGLLIGMNAQVEIIISEKENVFTVPYDAITENENGESIIYRREGEEFVPVVVTKGMQTDYYVEISADTLAEGDIVRASAQETVNNSQEETESFNMPGGMNFEGSLSVEGHQQGGAVFEMSPPGGFAAQGGKNNG